MRRLHEYGPSSFQKNLGTGRRWKGRKKHHFINRNREPEEKKGRADDEQGDFQRRVGGGLLGQKIKNIFHRSRANKKQQKPQRSDPIEAGERVEKRIRSPGGPLFGGAYKRNPAGDVAAHVKMRNAPR